MAVIFCNPIFAQKYCVSGNIYDLNSKVPIKGVEVRDVKHNIVTVSGNGGFFSLILPVDSAKIVFSISEYYSKELAIFVSKNSILDIYLKLSTISHVVKPDTSTYIKPNERIAAGSISFMRSTPLLLPVLIEADPAKTVQLFTGIQQSIEGNTALFVRGGSGDQNLFNIDGVAVYAPSHLYGYFSAFDKNMVEKFTVRKSGFLSSEAGRLSSVTGVDMREGSAKGWGGNASISIATMSISIDGPLSKNVSAIFSWHRSYIDLVLNPNVVDTGSYIYPKLFDGNFKISAKLNKNNRLVFSGWQSSDYYEGGRKQTVTDTLGTTIIKQQMQFLEWKNSLLSVKLFSRIGFGKNIISSISLTKSNYGFTRGLLYIDKNQQKEVDVSKASYINGFNSLILKSEYSNVIDEKNILHVGAEIQTHIFTPKKIEYIQLKKLKNSDTVFGSGNIICPEISLYSDVEHIVNSHSKFYIGTRFTQFNGYNKNYIYFDPHFNYITKIKKHWQLTASFDVMHQSVNAADFSGNNYSNITLLPATELIKPQRSMQWSASASKYINNLYTFSSEIYYKTFSNLLEIRNGKRNFFLDTKWDDFFSQNLTGKAMGLELILKKNDGILNGWVAYTLAFSNRTQSENGNTAATNYNTYSYRFDRRNTINIVLYIKAAKGRVWSMIYTIMGGNYVTVPQAKYRLPNNTILNPDWNGTDIYIIPNRNNMQLPSYHRFDIAYNRVRHSYFWKESQFGFSVYNLFNNINPYDFIFNRDRRTGKISAHELGFLPIIPSINYIVKF